MTKGMYGAFGGQYAPETLMIALEELENAYEQVKDDADFQQELQFYLREYANRPSLLYYARKMSEELGGAKTVSYTHLDVYKRQAVYDATPIWEDAWVITIGRLPTAFRTSASGCRRSLSSV